MNRRHLYIAAYDIADPARLREGLAVLKDYASGRQKSVFECFLSEGEKRTLLDQVHALIDPEADRFLLLRLDPRGKLRTLGKAIKPQDPSWFYVG
jgi:CRISPR-associated protein Cas2